MHQQDVQSSTHQKTVLCTTAICTTVVELCYRGVIMPLHCIHWVSCSLSASCLPYSVGTSSCQDISGRCTLHFVHPPEGSSPRELLSSTTGGLASVIDAALGMLLGSETSGTAAHLFGVFAMVMSVVSCNFASTPRASCIQQVLKLYRQCCVGLSRHLVNMLMMQ